jgi:hypothetical protein
MYNNKSILDYTSQISQKEIYRNMKAKNLTNKPLQSSNQKNLNSIKKQLNFDNHDLLSHDYHNTFSQERNHKNAKINRFISLDHNLENITIQLNLDNYIKLL